MTKIEELEKLIDKAENTPDKWEVNETWGNVTDFILNSCDEFFTILDNEDISPKSKGIIIESIRDECLYYPKDNPQLGERLFNKILNTIEKYNSEKRKLDNYVYASTTALRMLPIPEEKRPYIANLMRNQIESNWRKIISEKPWPETRSFAQSFFVLGSNGDATDVKMITEIIDGDKEYWLMGYSFLSLERIMRFNPDKITEQDSKEIQRVCSDVLSKYATPEKLHIEEKYDESQKRVTPIEPRNIVDEKYNNFHKSATAINTLCARLDKEELDLAFKYAMDSKDPSLIHPMAREIKEAEGRLKRGGQTEWLKNHKAYADKVRDELKKYPDPFYRNME